MVEVAWMLGFPIELAMDGMCEVVVVLVLGGYIKVTMLNDMDLIMEDGCVLGCFIELAVYSMCEVIIRVRGIFIVVGLELLPEGAECVLGVLAFSYVGGPSAWAGGLRRRPAAWAEGLRGRSGLAHLHGGGPDRHRVLSLCYPGGQRAGQLPMDRDGWYGRPGCLRGVRGEVRGCQ